MGSRTHRRARGRALVPLAVVAAVCAGCGSSGSSGPAAATAVPSVAGSAAPTTAPPPTVTASPTAAVQGHDDINGDGQPDPVCGTQDFGAGLVLRIPCDVSSAHEPESGTTLVAKSLYRLPTPDDVDLTGISGELIGGRDPHGGKVEILIFNSDALFSTGSSAVGSTDSLSATVRLVDAHWPGSVLQVRGHTDDTGSAAGNQTLSEQRARTVRQYLLSHGVRASSVSAVGLGSTRPLVRNDTPEGRAFNRRVELLIRVPNA